MFFARMSALMFSQVSWGRAVGTFPSWCPLTCCQSIQIPIWLTLVLMVCKRSACGSIGNTGWIDLIWSRTDLPVHAIWQFKVLLPRVKASKVINIPCIPTSSLLKELWSPECPGVSILPMIWEHAVCPSMIQVAAPVSFWKDPSLTANPWLSWISCHS